MPERKHQPFEYDLFDGQSGEQIVGQLEQSVNRLIREAEVNILLMLRMREFLASIPKMAVGRMIPMSRMEDAIDTLLNGLEGAIRQYEIRSDKSLLCPKDSPSKEG